MRRGRWLLTLGLLATPVLRAEVWQTSRGAVEGSLSEVYGPFAIIARPTGSSLVSLNLLGEAETGRVADFIAARATTTPRWKDSNSKVARALKDKLVVLRNGKFVSFELGERPEPQFYLVYFGAFWCGPCRRFSPGFVQTYQRLQQLAPDRFEVVFVSSDEDSGEQLKYANEVKMPWPVLRFSRLGSAGVIERWAGRGIPCVVALTRDGDLLFHSYHGDEYVGPQQVLQEFEGLLRAGMAPDVKVATHKLAVAQQIRSAGATGARVKPYLIALDLKKYQTLETNALTATLAVDEKGEVTSAAFEPKQSAVIDYQLVDDASHWLFLPEIKKGRPVATKVVLPIKLR